MSALRLFTDSARCGCPYCGEQIELVVDLSVEEQRYVEDCQVCCQPMVVAVFTQPDDSFTVSVYREDD